MSVLIFVGVCILLNFSRDLYIHHHHYSSLLNHCRKHYYCYCCYTMGAIDIAELQYTSLDDIQARITLLRKSFNEHKTRDVDFRLVQLRRLYWA